MELKIGKCKECEHEWIVRKKESTLIRCPKCQKVGLYKAMVRNKGV